MTATIIKNITTDGDHLIGTTADIRSGTLAIAMTGTGTWTWKFSPDNGATLIDMEDSSGAFTGTTSAAKNFDLGAGVPSARGAVYLTVSGASGLDLDAYVFSG